MDSWFPILKEHNSSQFGKTNHIKCYILTPPPPPPPVSYIKFWNSQIKRDKTSVEDWLALRNVQQHNLCYHIYSSPCWTPEYVFSVVTFIMPLR